MEYTVKEVAQATGVSVKTLHYYHQIGLLLPCRITAAGYRLYSEAEMARLQQILVYRELNFPLKTIHNTLAMEENQLTCLRKQQSLLREKRQRTDRLLRSISRSISLLERGEKPELTLLFQDFNQGK
jgi:DNA-binding transcriptional MerR regulator